MEKKWQEMMQAIVGKKYNIPTNVGTFVIAYSDIFMPCLGLEYSNYDGVVDNIETGAHWLGARIAYE